MMIDPIIGNGTVIYPNAFNNLTYDDIRRWRKLIYSKISDSKSIKKSDLQNIQLDNDYNIRSIIFREKILSSSLMLSDITFISFDSSYICKTEVNLINIINNLNGNIVLIDTYIQYIECKFKIMNPTKTNKSVNINNVKNYMDLFDQKIKCENKNINYIHRLSFDEANKYLFYYEKKFYDTNPKKVYKGLRNEFNDDAMIHILGTLKNKFNGINLIFYTLDKAMIDKCLDVNITTITTV